MEKGCAILHLKCQKHIGAFYLHKGQIVIHHEAFPNRKKLRKKIIIINPGCEVTLSTVCV